MSLLNETIESIIPVDKEAAAQARARLEQLTMPYWALGRLLDLAEQLAGITGTTHPNVDKRIVLVMAGDHGVVKEGVSAFPQEVTVQMVLNFLKGGAGINALARTARADLAVMDVGVAGEIPDVVVDSPEVIRFYSKKIARGTANMAIGPAMTMEQAVQSIEAGISITIGLNDYDVFGTGEMGIGNTTPSSAIVSLITGEPPEKVTGRGTGICDETLDLKIKVIAKSIAVNRPDPTDAMDVLMKIGGFEIGAIAGVILGAASLRKPVIIDGLISTAGALIAYGLSPLTADYMIAGHRSMEQGHKAALAHLKKEPLLDLDFRLGEGTGAALAMTLVEAAVRVMIEMATFSEAAVSTAD